MVSCRPNLMVFAHKIEYLIGQFTDCPDQNVALRSNLAYKQRLCLDKYTNESITIQYWNDIFKILFQTVLSLVYHLLNAIFEKPPTYSCGVTYENVE